jgi:protein phosphatase
MGQPLSDASPKRCETKTVNTTLRRHEFPGAVKRPAVSVLALATHHQPDEFRSQIVKVSREGVKTINRKEAAGGCASAVSASEDPGMSPFHDTDTAEIPITSDPARRHFEQSPPPVRAEFGALSHPGLVRTNNEDHFLVVRRRRVRDILLTNLPEGFLVPQEEEAYALAVADGIGGAAFGEMASMLALRTAWDLGTEEIKWHFKTNPQEDDEIKEKFALFIQMIDRALIEHSRQEARLAGMGTTLTAAYTIGPEAFIAHAGDSRAYLHRQGALTRLTRDHTVGEQLAEAGLPCRRSLRHVLTNCLGGGNEGVEVEVHQLTLADGDGLLLCTDGLTDMIPEPEIADILSQHSAPADACRVLVERALEAGGKDNVTVVLGRYALVPAAQSSVAQRLEASSHL